MSDNNDELNYLGEEELLHVTSPFATGTSGYIEEQVDIWVKEASKKHEDLINEFNKIVYRTQVAEGRVAELEQEAVALNEELSLAKNALINATSSTNYDASSDVLEKNSIIANLEAELAATQASLHATEAQLQEERETAELRAQAVVAPVVETPVVNTQSDVSIASSRAQRILESAAEEATEHVTRSLERVESIENEAREEAETIKADAANAAETVRSAASAEAEAIKANALVEASDALDRLNNARAEIRELFTRVTAFHSYELNRSKEIFGLVEDAETGEPVDAPATETVSLPEEEEVGVTETAYVEDILDTPSLLVDDEDEEFSYDYDATATPAFLSETVSETAAVTEEEETEAYDIKPITVESYEEEAASESWVQATDQTVNGEGNPDEEKSY